MKQRQISVYDMQAKIQVPAGSGFREVGECLDTPNAIREEIARLRKRNNWRMDLWVQHVWGNRDHIGFGADDSDKAGEPPAASTRRAAFGLSHPIEEDGDPLPEDMGEGGWENLIDQEED